MYGQSCGNEIAVELKYCNRCGANLALTNTNTQLVTLPPVKLAIPSIALALTIIAGLGIIMGGAAQMSMVGVPAIAVVWMVIFAGSHVVWLCVIVDSLLDQTHRPSTTSFNQYRTTSSTKHRRTTLLSAVATAS
jgi:hypothetical protein